jgi:Zn-finger nucleic acid-binding protein
MVKLTNLPKSNSEIAWCPKCKDEFITYNLALAKCPRCGGGARTNIKRLVVKTATLLVVLAVLVVVGVGAYTVLKGRGIIGGSAQPAAVAAPQPPQPKPAG